MLCCGQLKVHFNEHYNFIYIREFDEKTNNVLKVISKHLSCSKVYPAKNIMQRNIYKQFRTLFILFHFLFAPAYGLDFNYLNYKLAIMQVYFKSNKNSL